MRIHTQSVNSLIGGVSTSYWINCNQTSSANLHRQINIMFNTGTSFAFPALSLAYLFMSTSERNFLATKYADTVKMETMFYVLTLSRTYINGKNLHGWRKIVPAKNIFKLYLSSRLGRRMSWSSCDTKVRLSFCL